MLFCRCDRIPWPRTAYAERDYFGLHFICIHVNQALLLKAQYPKQLAGLTPRFAGQPIQSNHWAPGSEGDIASKTKVQIPNMHLHTHSCTHTHIQEHKSGCSYNLPQFWHCSQHQTPHLSQTTGTSHRSLSLMSHLATKPWGPTAPIFVFSHLIERLTELRETLPLPSLS